MTPALAQVLAKPAWVLPYGPVLDIDFVNQRAWAGNNNGGGSVAPPDSLLTVSRASSETSLLPTSASGAAYLTFVSGKAAQVPGVGLQAYEARTNLLLNSTAPATQTTASLGTGTYTLWVNGAGSATSSAGSAVGSGFGAATNGTPNVFNLSGAGTVVVTVAGALNAFQLEIGTFGTPLIVTAGVTVARAADVVTVKNPPVFGAAYTLFGAGTPQAPVGHTAVQTILNISDGTAANRAQIYRNATTEVAVTLSVVANVTQGVGTGAVWGTGTTGKLAAAFTIGDQAASFNGAAPFTAVPASIPIPTTVQIGNRPTGATQWNGYISRVALWLTNLPPAAIVSLAR